MAKKFEDIKVAIEKEIAKENELSLYKITDDLNYKFDDTGVYIPFNQGNISLKLSRNESKKSEIIYTWTKYTNNRFQTLTINRSDKLINEEDKKLIKNLTTTGKQAGLEIDEDDMSSFVETFKSDIIQANCLSVLKEPDFEFPEEMDVDDLDQTETHTIKFEDYDELVQKEALTMLKEDTLFDNIVFSISWTHEGDMKFKRQLPLILSSVFIDQPVHSELNADTGVGKTDIIIETSKNYPPFYIYILRTISPKNIYYDRDSYGDFNILIFDDVVLTEPMIEVIKELADNNKPFKELKTVIDGKAKTFTLEGKFLVILTYAKNNPDEELLNRLYKLNIIIQKSNKANIKEKVRGNTVINSDNNEIIKRSRLIIQAGIQYLVEKDIIVFNPFTLMFDPSKLNNRNIKGFITLVKSKTFFHAFKRKNIQIGGKTIYIGSYGDYTFVKDVWDKSAKTQKFKLNANQEKILEYLPEKTREDAYKDHKASLEKYKNAVSRNEKDKILEDEYTRNNISKATGINKSTLRNYLDKSEGTAKSLEEMGLVGKIKFDSDNPSSPLIYYKIKKNDEVPNGKSSACVGCQSGNDNHFDDLNFKLNVLYSLLVLSNIPINEEGWEYLNFYCENYTDEITADDYDSYYNFINGAIEGFDIDKYSVNIYEAKYSDLAYVKKVDTLIKISKILTPHDYKADYDNLQKMVENTPSDEKGRKAGVKSHLTCNTRGFRNTELAYNICLCLMKDSLTVKEITDKLYENYYSDDVSVDFLAISVIKCIEDLVNCKLVSQNTEDDEIEYQASDSFKQLLGGS